MHRRPAPLAVLVALLLGTLTPCARGAEDPVARRVAAAADAVVAAIETRDPPTLARLAAQDDPDPWLVADALFARGRLDAARAFAKAAPRPDVERLPAYLETLDGASDDGELRARLGKANEALTAGRFEEAVAITDPPPPPPLDRVVRVRLAVGRANALGKVGRPADAVSQALAAARDAERMGWLARAVWTFSLAAQTAKGSGDLPRARDACAEGLSVSERRGAVARRWTAELHGLLADVLEEQAAHADAVAHYRKALAAFEALGDEAWQASVRVHLAASLRHLDPSAAFEEMARAIPQLEKVGDRVRLAGACLELGNEYRRQGRDDEARAAYERAVAASETGGDPSNAAAAAINLAILTRKAGRADEAVALWERGLRLAAEAGKRQFEFSALRPLLDEYLARDDAAKATECGQRLVALAEELGFRDEAGRALWQLGNLYARRGEAAEAVVAFGRAADRLHSGDYRSAFLGTRGLLGYPTGAAGRDAALAALERVVAEARAASDLRVVGELEWALGDERVGARDFAAARELFRRARASFQAASRPERAAEMLHQIAESFAEERDVPKALATYEQAVRASEAVGDRMALGTGLFNIANLHLTQGDLLKALAVAERALAVFETLDDKGSLGSTLGMLGVIFTYRGEHAKALAVYDRALTIFTELGLPSRAADVLHNMGVAYNGIGDAERALEHHRRALLVYESEGDLDGTARALTNVGADLTRLERFDEAKEAAERAVAIFERLGDAREVAIARGSIARMAMRRKAWPSALETLEAVLPVLEKAGDRYEAANVFHDLGEVHENLGDATKALQWFERASRAAEKLGSVHVQVGALAGTARVRLRAGEAGRAMDAAHRAVLLLKSLVGGLGEEQGARARGAFVDLFATGLAAAAQVDDPAEAVFFLESGRAGSLLEALGAQAALSSESVPEDLRRADRDARAAEAAARAAYAQVADGDDLAVARARKGELEQARSRVQEVVERIQRAEKKARLWYPVATPVEDLQALLAPEDALVLYGLAPDGAAHAVVLTSSSARIVGLGAARAVHEACEALDMDEVEVDPTASLARLAALTVAPLALPPEVRRVLVSPDGPLSYVPFAVLLPDHEVAYVASGSTYAELVGSRGPRGEKVLALADPDYTAKFEPTAHSIYALDARGGVATRGRTFVPLPGTRAEAQAVADVRLLGRKASEAGLRQVLAEHGGRWRSVHFACHGLVDPERPTLSSLVLTPDAGDDGFLTALEVLRMQIPADLVVLSACETGRGKIVTGEGIVGLTRAFMYAGAPCVVCSLWKVDDDATRALMTKFYEVWKGDKASTATALREAQRFVRAQEKWKHPYYWAAWVLWGLP